MNVRAGLRVGGAGETVDFDPDDYNAEAPGSGPCYYDLLYGGELLPGDGRTLVRLAGVRILQVIHTEAGQGAPVLPVGICLSFAKGTLPAGWSEGRELDIELAELTDVAQAVEAGPMLVNDGSPCIDMDLEGWTTKNSIATQAARLDYLDMRGPKFAVGSTERGNYRC